jgi:hypothetical protein
VDERRLYDVGARGGAWTAREEPEAQTRRLARLRWLLAFGVLANGASWTLAGVALVLGGREWGAAFGTVALLTVPMLGLPLLMEGAARLRALRRHRTRPQEFPGGSASSPPQR